MTRWANDLFYNRDILIEQIRSNCCPITLTVEDMLECVDLQAGIDMFCATSVIKRKINEAHQLALERTFAVEQPAPEPSSDTPAAQE